MVGMCLGELRDELLRPAPDVGLMAPADRLSPYLCVLPTCAALSFCLLRCLLLLILPTHPVCLSLVDTGAAACVREPGRRTSWQHEAKPLVIECRGLAAEQPLE